MKENFYDLKSKITSLLRDFREICDKELRDAEEEIEELIADSKD